MNKGFIIFAGIVLVYTLYLCAMVSKDPDYMIGDEFKKGTFQPSVGEVDEVAEETTETAEIGTFEVEELSIDVVTGTEAQTEEEEPQRTYHTVNGEALDYELYEFIRVTLSSMNLSHLMPFVLCQIYQESRFDVMAEATNGQDKGLLQFRLRYWDWEDGDIFDPYAQLRVYLARIKEKSDAGVNIYEIISDHYTGGAYYSEEYVHDVMQWMETVEIRKA